MTILNIKSDVSRLFSGLIILAMIVFVWWFSYINEPIGDDILCYYDNALTYYLDEFSFSIGNRISSINQIANDLIFTYMYWSGRMTGYLFMLLGKLLPKYAQAFFTSVIFVANILLAIRIACKNTNDLLEHPLLFVSVGAVVYWYRVGCYYEYMWIMVAIYSLPVMLLLLYYNLNKERKIWMGCRNIAVMEMLGFGAGFSHEILSLLIIIAVFVDVLKEWKFKHESLKLMLRHTGLFIGYILCVFSPGNFNRMLQKHDVVTNTLLERIVVSFKLHLSSLGGDMVGRCFFIVAFLFACGVLMNMIFNNMKYKQIIFDRLGLISACILSIFLCALPPHYPIYGMDLWILMVYGIVFSFIVEFKNNKQGGDKKSSSVLALLVVALLGYMNYSEIFSYYSVSSQRKMLVEQASQQGLETIEVPRFPEDLSRERYYLKGLNDQEEYNTDYYRAYYGTRLILK